MAETNYMRIGDILVERGVLSAPQRDAILEEQSLSGRPFGDIAERLYGVRAGDVEGAWAEQFASIADVIDPIAARPDPHALRMIEPRQARQFDLLPLRFDGENLIVCTTPRNVARALRFLGWRVGAVCHIVLAEPEPLAQAIERAYPSHRAAS